MKPTPKATHRAALSEPAQSCALPLTFPAATDDYPHASFRRTADSNTFDWINIGLAQAAQLALLPDKMLRLLEQLGRLALAYPISLLDHSLQTATRAQRAGASDDLVLAALCHRAGMALSVEGYAEVSAAILRGYITEDVYQLVRHYPEYAPQPMGASARARSRYAAEAWHADAVRFCDEWATPAYDPNYDSLPLSAFEPLVRSKLGASVSGLYLTQNDCIGATQP